MVVGGLDAFSGADGFVEAQGIMHTADALE